MKIRNIMNTFTEVKNQTGKAFPVFQFLDLKYEIKRNHLLQYEYFAYEFYNKSKSERKEYVVDWECMNIIPDLFNDKDQISFLDDKSKFDEMFEDLLGRDYLFIDSQSRDKFNVFIKNHNNFIVKPLYEMGGAKIKKVHNASKDTFDSLIAEYETCLIEELLIQNELIASLNPDTVNTLRIIAFRDKNGQVQIPFANIRIGRKGSAVDNFSSGGMTAAIHIDTGKIISDAHDKAYKLYHVHPDSGVLINGFVVPCWDDVLTTVKTAMNRLPKMRLVGWDVAISKNNKVCLIEGNHNPGARIHQISLNRGLKNEYKKMLGEF